MANVVVLREPKTDAIQVSINDVIEIVIADTGIPVTADSDIRFITEMAYAQGKIDQLKELKDKS